MDLNTYLRTKAINRGQGAMVDPVSAAAAAVKAVAVEMGRGPQEEAPHPMKASALIAKMGQGGGALAKRLGKTWQKNVSKNQLKKLDYKSHLDQLYDAFERADLTDNDGLDPIEFSQAFHGFFPPWKKPVDEHIATVTLTTLFMKIDANGELRRERKRGEGREGGREGRGGGEREDDALHEDGCEGCCVLGVTSMAVRCCC